VQVVVMLKEQEAAGPVGTIAREAGATIAPQHPGVDDPELSRWYSAQVPDRAVAERLVAALSASDAVESAYMKPDEEPAG
jgi:hypothetical protein